MPGMPGHLLSVVTAFVPILFSLVFTVIKVVAYVRFRLPSLLWYMIGGLWGLTEWPLRLMQPHQTMQLTDKVLSAGGGLKAPALVHLREIQQVEGLILALISYALTLVFLILLMRDLHRLLDNQRPVAVPPPAG